MTPNADDGTFPALLRGAKEGDATAWRELAKLVGPPVLALARARGADDPEDCLSEVYVGLVRGIVGFEGDLGGFRAWALRIAYSRVIDERRRRTRRPQTLVAEVPETATADDVAEALAGSDRVRDLLDLLSPLQRDIVTLRVIGGLSVEETATIVGKRPGAVRVAHHRALARLRDGWFPADVTEAVERTVGEMT